MNLKEIRELIEFLKEQDIAEFELERGDVKVRIKRGVEAAAASTRETHYVTVPSAVPLASIPVDPAASPSPESAKPVEKKPELAPEENLHLVKSPIVGTFYESPSPGAPPFVKPGDNVAAGQVLCIVEAMKLMNEIESDVAGEIVKMLVTNNQPIEYGQALYAIRPNA